MFVSELIELLKTYDAARIVVMASDEEGNSFSPLADVGQGMYLEETKWSGAVCNMDEDYHEDSYPVVTLWPTR